MRTSVRIWCLILVLLASVAGFAAQNTAEAGFRTLYRFPGGADGMNPEGPLLFKSGALYVAASRGGSSTGCNSYNVGSCGVILKLTPPATATGLWTRIRIHSFTGGIGGVERHGRPRGPEDLKSHAILDYGRPSSQSAWALRGARAPLSVPYRLCSNNGDALRVAAIAGLGITLIPAFLVRDEVQTGRLVTVLDGFEPKPIDLYAIYPPTRFLAAKVRLFIDFLVERFLRARP